jgi:hypothetical protein
MGEPFGKGSACLREAASAKAGANLQADGHSPIEPLLEFTLVKSSDSLKTSY